jgi:hypothetical protein
MAALFVLQHFAHHRKALGRARTTCLPRIHLRFNPIHKNLLIFHACRALLGWDWSLTWLVSHIVVMFDDFEIASASIMLKFLKLYLSQTQWQTLLK